MKKIFTYFSLIFFAFFMQGCSFAKIDMISIPENEEVVAIIYHSEMIGVDAGEEYTYYIYKDNEDYLYFKYISSITIKGSEEEKFVKSGRLKTKEDFSIIENDIKNDNKTNAESYVSYDYYEKNIRNRYKTMEELLEKIY